ncbi:MAG: glycoside hydrolase family 3 N-terminal domain-containing protein [Henriciella sp.]|nr:glycoside hydrolase family 3 N-terminal domain-containing protein [Henriciella sp.]
MALQQTKLQVMIGFGLALTAFAVSCVASTTDQAVPLATPINQIEISTRTTPLLEQDGLTFRDLNRNGALDPYEDWRLSPDARADNLISLMKLEEKAAAMIHPIAPLKGPSDAPASQAYRLDAAEERILKKHITFFLTRLSSPPAKLAASSNAMQEIAERGRLGIPLTISTDPRNHFQETLGASVVAAGVSQWPDTLGLAAIGDPETVREFADIARREYRAVGIHMALHPMADLGTEPRWPRFYGTFGEDADLAHDLTEAYVEGFQNGRDGLNTGSVITIAKHWVGYGAAVDGWDGHNYYGQMARADGALDLHIRPFEGALAANVAGVMPSYVILEDEIIDGDPVEPVAAGFNKQILTDLLRGTHGFDGLVLSDWSITKDCSENCRLGLRPPTRADIGMPWGVEDLTVPQRFAKSINAGVDQFGGENHWEPIIEALSAEEVSETQIDEAVQRIMVQKFALGLFDNPFVDPAAANGIVGTREAVQKAKTAQHRSLVILENREMTLPLSPGTKVYLSGPDKADAEAAGLIPVDTLANADIAIVAMRTPYELLHPNHFFGRRHHEGRLDFRPGDLDFDAFTAAAAKVPTIAVVYLDRPAILTDVKARAAGLIAHFGISDAALMDVVTGRAMAEGRMPFELPSSMADVEAQSPGLPSDTANPLYPIGAGLRISNSSE